MLFISASGTIKVMLVRHNNDLGSHFVSTLVAFDIYSVVMVTNYKHIKLGFIKFG